MPGEALKVTLVVLVAATCTTLCAAQANTCFPGEQNTRSTSITRSVESFGLSLFTFLASSSPQQSIFVSPYSLWSALALAYFGAEGNTKKELEQALGVNSKTGTFFGYGALKLLLETNPSGSPGTNFRSSNKAYFANWLVLDRCLSTIITDGLKQVDFRDAESARQLINHDVNITTEGRIPNLIQDLPPSTRFALINAVFFKGLWETAFQPKLTRRQEFLVPPGQSPGVVKMMVQEGTFKHGVSESLGAEVLELPYLNSNFSMFLFVPTAFSTESILKNLTPQTFIETYKLMTPKKVEVGLPRFKMETRLEKELIALLYRMGVRDLFDESKANLTDFTRSATLFVDTIIHQATVEVTEEGTVAAAATALINTRFGGPEPIKFMCNRPFVYTITDKASAITLFAGHVVNSAHLKNI